jgi:hypothetical protein
MLFSEVSNRRGIEKTTADPLNAVAVATNAQDDNAGCE